MSRLNEAEKSFVHDKDMEVDRNSLFLITEGMIGQILRVNIYHERYKFVYSFQLPTITHSRDYYIASFGESLLLTLIGLEARVNRQIGDLTSVQVDVVNGLNPFSCEHTNTFHYHAQSDVKTYSSPQKNDRGQGQLWSACTCKSAEKLLIGVKHPYFQYHSERCYCYC